jgi:hypothetical protein
VVSFGCEALGQSIETMQNDRTAPSHATPDSTPGLCADCVHARLIQSDRRSTFLQCQLSFTDPRFDKYPRLPVLACDGYTKRQYLARM